MFYKEDTKKHDSTNLRLSGSNMKNGSYYENYQTRKRIQLDRWNDQRYWNEKYQHQQTENQPEKCNPTSKIYHESHIHPFE